MWSKPNCVLSMRTHCMWPLPNFLSLIRMHVLHTYFVCQQITFHLRLYGIIILQQTQNQGAWNNYQCCSYCQNLIRVHNRRGTGNCVLHQILSWCWWNFLTSANQIAQIGSCDRSRIHVPDLGGTGVWPGEMAFIKSIKTWMLLLYIRLHL